MNTPGINLFIVDDNKIMVTDLKYYLQDRFGRQISISTFDDGESCLKKVDKKTHIVILDYFLEGKNGLEILKSIKAINPKTEVIMLSGNESIGLAIDTFKAGAKSYVFKGNGALQKISKLVHRILTEPIKIIVREFKVSKFVATFLLTFITMGIVVAIVLQMLK